MSVVITTDYRKDTKWPAGHGYGRQVAGLWSGGRAGLTSSIIVHSTNGVLGSTFAAECRFIRDSALVSCHDEISHDGTIAVILPTDKQAWHAGAALPAFTNDHAHGIELHNTKGEQLTPVQIDSLTWRVKQLITQFSIPKDRIDTHRAVALPPGRKTDPSGWTDDAFYAWRDSLYGTPVPHPKLVYYTATAAARVRQGPGTMYLAVRTMPAGEVAGFDGETIGESIDGNNVWAHHADGQGFTWSGLLVQA